MQTFLSHETRRLTRTLENFTDDPPAIDWDEAEREAWPTIEFHHEGRQFKPSRWERAGKGPAVYVPGDILRAPPSVLMGLHKEGKINCELPHALIGHTRDTDEVVILPWLVTSANPPEPFDSTLVRVRLRKNVNVVNGIKLQVGQTFFLPYRNAFECGLGFPGSSLELLSKL